MLRTIEVVDYDPAWPREFERIRGRIAPVLEGLVIGIEHRHGALDDDRSMIKMFVHQMDRAAADLDAIIQSLLLHVEPGKCR